MRREGAASKAAQEAAAAAPRRHVHGKGSSAQWGGVRRSPVTRAVLVTMSREEVLKPPSQNE